MQQILYLLQKEFRQVFRDRAMLAIMFIAPIMQTIVLGFSMTVDVKNIRLIIFDADQSVLSRELGRSFANNPYFDFSGYAEAPQELRDQLDRWQTQIGIHIDRDFSRNIQRGERASILLMLDGLDGNTAGIAAGYAQGILAEFAQGIGQRASTIRMALSGLPGTANMRSRPTPVTPVTSETRFWYNLNLNSKNYMVPGLIGVLLTVVTLFLTSMGLVREKEIGTLEQLMVTPITSTQLIVGKVLPFLLIGFVELNVMLAAAFVIFDLQLAGSYLLLVGVAQLYFLTTLGLGIFISTLAETQQQALFISWFFMIFIILMSGFFTPIANMPDFWQMVTYLNPARYFISLIREIFLKATPINNLWREIIPLAIFGVVILSASTLKFKKRIS